MNAVTLTLSMRDYQQTAIEEVFSGLDNGHIRQVLAMPTGSGKTETAAGILARWIQSGRLPPGTRPYFIVDRIVLARQAAERFYRLGFNVGILQGDNSTPRTFNEDVMVASIQSIGSRYRTAPDDMGAMIIDECHIHHERHTKLLDALNAVPVVGLSATPLRQSLGLHYSRLIKGPSTADMIADKWLVGTKAYGPSKPDMVGVTVTAGDYNQRETAQRMQQITGDIVSHWQRLGENRPTIAFCCNIAHATEVAEDFRSEGITAEVVHHKVPGDEVVELIKRFEAKHINILCSVTKLAVGFDSPIASCAIMARPTLSEMLYIQMAGRVMRPFDGKLQAIIIDHAGNVERFGKPDDFLLPDSLDESELEARADSKRRDLPDMLPCPECAFMVPRMERECPECGYSIRRPNIVEVTDGRLVDLDTPAGRAIKDLSDEWIQRQRFYAELLGLALEKGYKPGFAAIKFKERHNEWPPSGWRRIDPVTPTTATRRWIQSRLIAWRNAQRSA